MVTSVNDKMTFCDNEQCWKSKVQRKNNKHLCLYQDVYVWNQYKYFFNNIIHGFLSD